MWAILVHDRGSLAWIIVAAYAVGALLAFAAAGSSSGRERTFWIGAAITLLLLGINKQLDLQTDLTTVLRAAALSEGWYGDRRDAQGAFILLIALFGAICGFFLSIGLRETSTAVKVAAAGLMVLVAFVFVRAASFHHIDYWVTISIAGLRSGWWLELLGIAIIACAAGAYRFRNGGNSIRDLA